MSPLDTAEENLAKDIRELASKIEKDAKEADVQEKFVVPLFKKLGYVEEDFTREASAGLRKTGEADIILKGKGNICVEVKDNDVSLESEKIMEQLEEYSMDKEYNPELTVLMNSKEILLFDASNSDLDLPFRFRIIKRFNFSEPVAVKELGEFLSKESNDNGTLSRGLAEYRKHREVILEKAAQTNEVAESRKQMREVEIEKVNKEWRGFNDEIKAIKTKAAAARARMENLQEGMDKEFEEAQEAIQAELDKAGFFDASSRKLDAKTKELLRIYKRSKKN